MKVLLVLIAIIGAVLAADPPRVALKDINVEKELKDFYAVLDTKEDPADKKLKEDNKVTEAEFVAAILPADKNGDGIDVEEFKAHFKTDDKVDEAVFREFDNDHDGKITDVELKKDYQEFDVDDDQNLDRLEFIEAITLGFIFDDIESDDKDTEISKAEWKDFFGKVDADKSGGVCIGELEAYLPKYYPEDVIAKFFDELDDNDDGDLIMVELVLNHYAFDEDNKKGEEASLKDTEFRWSVSTGADGQIFEKLDTDVDKKDHENQLTHTEIMAMDTDGNGQISLDEMKAALYGVPEHSDLILFKDLDENNNETIDADEVTKFIKESQFPPEDDQLSWVEFDAAVDADD